MILSIQASLTKRRVKRSANAALEWLRNHWQDFRISRVQDDPVPWQIKPLMELMFFLSTLKRHGINNEALDFLAARALEEGSDFDWHEVAAYDPSAATPLALIADFFQSHGRPAPFDARFFGFLNQIEFFEGMDRLPYREMDLAHSLGRVISPDYYESLPVWFASTAFGRQQHIARYTIDDVYSLTHAVFYLTDIGLRDIERYLEPAAVSRLRSELATLAAMMLRADNADVLGELLLCWLFCSVEKSGTQRVIFDQALESVLASATTEGAVAPTSGAYHKAERGQATFKQLYHTTLVGAMLFALLSHKPSYAGRLAA